MSIDTTKTSAGQLKARLQCERSGLGIAENVLAHVEAALDNMPSVVRDAVLQLIDGVPTSKLRFMPGTIPDPDITARKAEGLLRAVGRQ